MTVGYVFPGQGAQSVGMLADLRIRHAHIDERLQLASKVIGEDLVALVTDGPAERLNETEITQPVMLACSVALYECWLEAGGPEAHCVAGHSLGEYSALTAVGVFEFEHAISLVHERGKLMQSAVPAGEGAMAAILGVEFDELSAMCTAVDGVVSPANINAPGQIAIAGAKQSVDAVSEEVLRTEDRRRRVVPLDVSVPSHCALMQPAADGLESLLRETNMNNPGCPIYQNVDAAAAEDVEGIRQRLIAQLSSPVQWASIVPTMAASGCEQFIEVGPGKVLTGLARRIDRSLKAYSIGSVEDFDSTLETLT